VPHHRFVQDGRYLSRQISEHTSDDNLFINGALCPDDHLTVIIKELPHGNALVSAHKGEILAVSDAFPVEGSGGHQMSLYVVTYTEPFTMISNVWDIFASNGAQIKTDYERVASVSQSAEYYRPFTHSYKPENIFVEEGAVIKASVLNAENGPIYIGKNALIQEGSMIQGPFAIGENQYWHRERRFAPIQR
jgi:NDP-sugar pyrophosphorylase family protein